MARLLLGVDGGATKTVALVADEAGTVLGWARTGSSDIHGAVEPGAAVERVAEAVQGALSAAGAGVGDLGAYAFCLCGADWPEDDAYYAAELRARLGLGVSPLVMNDAFGALRAGTSDGLGVALVLGTGSAIAARGPSGATWFSGERMEASGATELGRQVYEHLIRGAYGPGPVPGFQDAALAVFEVDSVEALVHAVSRVGGPGRGGLGRLAPVLLEASHEGDPAAQAAVAAQGQLLAGYVRAAADRVGLPGEGSVVVLSGGLLRHRRTDLIGALADRLPGFHLAVARVEPAFGAVLMAADALGVAPSLERLRASGPDGSFFETL